MNWSDQPALFAVLVAQRYEAIKTREPVIEHLAEAHWRIERALEKIQRFGGRSDRATLDQLIEIAAVCISVTHSVVMPAIDDLDLSDMLFGAGPDSGQRTRAANPCPNPLALEVIQHAMDNCRDDQILRGCFMQLERMWPRRYPDYDQFVMEIGLRAAGVEPSEITA